MKVEGYLIQSRQPGSAKPRWGFVGHELVGYEDGLASLNKLQHMLPNTEWRLMALCHAEVQR